MKDAGSYWKLFGLLAVAAIALSIACGGEKTVEVTKVVERTVVVVATPTAAGAKPTAIAKVEPAPQPKTPAGSLTISVAQIGAGIGLNSAGSVSTACRSYGCAEDLFTWSTASREEPRLAESWTLSSDQKTVTIKVRKGVKFHNVDKDWGELKAQDLAWSYNELNPAINPTSIGWSAANLNATFGKNAVVALDDNTLKFTFHEFDVRWANSTLNESGQVGHMAVPKAAFDEKGADWVRTHIVATGPYKVNKWVQDDRIELEATNNHWKFTPKFKKVTLVRFPEQSTRVAAMLTGEIDAADLDSKTFTDMLARGFKHFGAGNDHQLGIFWAGNQWETVNAVDGTPLPSTGNCTRNLLWIGCPKIEGDMEQGRKVRHAVSIAIDRDAINQSVLSGLGYPNHVTWWDTKNPNWQSKWEYKFDPKAAAAELDAAGAKADSSGYRFDMPIWSGPSTPGEVGDAVAGFMADIGIKSEVLKYAYVIYRPGIVARTNNVPFLTECDDGYSPLPWDLPKGLVASSLTWGGFSCGFGTKEIADGYKKMSQEPDLNKRIQYSNEILDHIYQWNLITGLVVEPQTLTVNPNSVKEWPMRPTIIGSWTELYNAVPAR
jgi:ABC-type transport system substrate-binding protein